MNITTEDKELALACVRGAISEDELRERLKPSDAALIEALKQELRETRAERDQHAADIRELMAANAVLRQKLTELVGRVS
jgi:uncharacterized coiled-coil DUF342 family protein